MAEYLPDYESEDEPFHYDGRPYLFEPEYTDEELLQIQEQTRIAREGASRRGWSSGGTNATFWGLMCSCGCCDSAHRGRRSVLQRVGPVAQYSWSRCVLGWYRNYPTPGNYIRSDQQDSAGYLFSCTQNKLAEATKTTGTKWSTIHKVSITNTSLCIQYLYLDLSPTHIFTVALNPLHFFFSSRQYRLVACRVVLEGALRGERLGRGNRRVLSSFMWIIW